MCSIIIQRYLPCTCCNFLLQMYYWDHLNNFQPEFPWLFFVFQCHSFFQSGCDLVVIWYINLNLSQYYKSFSRILCNSNQFKVQTFSSKVSEFSLTVSLNYDNYVIYVYYLGISLKHSDRQMLHNFSSHLEGNVQRIKLKHRVS